VTNTGKTRRIKIKGERILCVYSGREMRGSIAIRGREFHAFRADGEPVGVFTTQRDAMGALSARAP
jgi:hypothetical protein